MNYYDESQDFIMVTNFARAEKTKANAFPPFQFVTRAVRVIDLITTLDMTSFQTNNGLQAFINRLEVSLFN